MRLLALPLVLLAAFLSLPSWAAGELAGERIAVVVVCSTGSCYADEVEAVGATLGEPADSGGPGATVHEYWLHSAGVLAGRGGPLVTDFAGAIADASQVWVIDLSAEADNQPPLVASFNDVGDWYEARNEPHIIVDARMMSSLWTGGQATSFYQLTRPDLGLLVRYATALAERGGGLLLATDHGDSFTRGINTVTQAVGIGPITGYFLQFPYLALVDDGHVLFHRHEEATYSVDELQPQNSGSFDAAYPACNGACESLLADSSVARVPVGPQMNPKGLVGVAWFGGDSNTPVVSTTIRNAAAPVAAITPAGPRCSCSTTASSSRARTPTAIRRSPIAGATPPTPRSAAPKTSSSRCPRARAWR